MLSLHSIPNITNQTNKSSLSESTPSQNARIFPRECLSRIGASLKDSLTAPRIPTFKQRKAWLVPLAIAGVAATGLAAYFAHKHFTLSVPTQPQSTADFTSNKIPTGHPVPAPTSAPTLSSRITMLPTEAPVEKNVTRNSTLPKVNNLISASDNTSSNPFIHPMCDLSASNANSTNHPVNEDLEETPPHTPHTYKEMNFKHIAIGGAVLTSLAALCCLRSNEEEIPDRVKASADKVPTEVMFSMTFSSEELTQNLVSLWKRDTPKDHQDKQGIMEKLLGSPIITEIPTDTGLITKDLREMQMDLLVQIIELERCVELKVYLTALSELIGLIPKNHPDYRKYKAAKSQAIKLYFKKLSLDDLPPPKIEIIDGDMAGTNSSVQQPPTKPFLPPLEADSNHTPLRLLMPPLETPPRPSFALVVPSAFPPVSPLSSPAASEDSDGHPHDSDADLEASDVWG